MSHTEAMRGAVRTVPMKQEVLDALRRQGEAISALGVKRVGLFGSVVRGEQNEGSDVDLLVEFKPGRKTFDSFTQLAFLLEEALGGPVDLVTIESLSPYIGPYILEEVEYVNLAA